MPETQSMQVPIGHITSDMQYGFSTQKKVNISPKPVTVEEKPLKVNPLTFEELLELKIKGNHAIQEPSIESSI
jgi:hypothetical protein